MPNFRYEAPGYEARIDEALSHPDELIKLLEALAQEPASAGLSKQLSYLLRHLRQGIKAQQFLSDERLCIWLPIVMSGEQASTLDTRYAQWLRQILDERNRRRSLIASFSYPLMLITIAVLLLLPICVFIVPSFQRMFAEFGLMLPAPTRLLFSIADLVNHRPHYLILGLAGVLALVAAGIYGWTSQALTTRRFGWLIAGNSVSLVAMSRLTSVLAELLELGAPLPEALLLAGRASRHAFYRQAAVTLAKHFASDRSAVHASPVARNFPTTLLHALSLVESQQPGVPIIRELSYLYSDRVSARLNRRSGISSPLMVIAVGMVVGLVVIALFMPLVSMVSSLT